MNEFSCHLSRHTCIGIAAGDTCLEESECIAEHRGGFLLAEAVFFLSMVISVLYLFSLLYPHGRVREKGRRGRCNYFSV